MSYTDNPKFPFLLAPSTKGLFKYSDIEIDWQDWTSVKRCLDIKLFLDMHVALSEDHTTFASTKGYLDWIFSRKSPFAQKLMVSILVRVNGKFKPKTKYSSGISYEYKILHDVLTQLSADINSALSTGIFSGQMKKYKPAHHRKNDKLWIKEIKELKERKSQQQHKQAIDSTFH